ncbi:MAG: energy-coupling factor ABC transporter ATP-binding protein [Syntrophobacteria bacterium]
MLEATGISHSFQRGTRFHRRVLHGLSVRLEPGQAVLLTGPSGSGKTTLARILAGLERPTEGVVCLQGRNLYGSAKRKATFAPAQVVMACQYPERQFIAGTVHEELSWGLRAGLGMEEPEISRRLMKICADLDFPLVELAHRCPRSLSSGQQRKVALASLLVLEPRVLISDEPFAGLNTRERRNVAQVLRRRSDAHGIMVLIAHELDPLLSWASRVLVISAGRLIFDGSVEGLYAHKDASVEAALSLPPLLELSRYLKQQAWTEGPVSNDLAVVYRQVREALEAGSQARHAH